MLLHLLLVWLQKPPVVLDVTDVTVRVYFDYEYASGGMGGMTVGLNESTLVTNRNGYCTFENVPYGEHTIILYDVFTEVREYPVTVDTEHNYFEFNGGLSL